jgi:hypothetical protein
MSAPFSSRLAGAVCGAALLAVSACTSPPPADQSQYAGPRAETGGQGEVLGAAGLGAPQVDSKNQKGADMIGVNAYLWRGALETLSFMPLSSADPFGGVIITDWYSPPSTPNERFKATCYILGRELRADGIRIAIFRQTRQGSQWVDADVAPSTVSDIEDKVLARARELRATGS